MDETHIRAGMKGKSKPMQRFRGSAYAAPPAWSEESGLTVPSRVQPQLFVAQFRCDTTLGRPLQVPLHNQVRLIDLFQRVRLFPDGDRQRAEPDRSATEFGYDCLENALIHFVEPVLIDF